MIERGVDVNTLKHAVRFNMQKLRGEFKPQLNILKVEPPQLRIVTEEKKEKASSVSKLNIITGQETASQSIATKAITPAITSKVVMPKIASRSPPRMQLRILPAAN
jgi:hypothetical protein